MTRKFFVIARVVGRDGAIDLVSMNIPLYKNQLTQFISGKIGLLNCARYQLQSHTATRTTGVKMSMVNPTRSGA